ncbi:MAG: hypothetical protein ACRD5F_07380 [Candidatus Acidiferrales bacterium]
MPRDSARKSAAVRPVMGSPFLSSTVTAMVRRVHEGDCASCAREQGAMLAASVAARIAAQRSGLKNGRRIVDT